MRSHAKERENEFVTCRRAIKSKKRTNDLDEKAVTAGVSGVKISARFHVLAVGNDWTSEAACT